MYRVFELLKLNLCECSRLNKAEPFKALLEKCVTHLGTAGTLEFHNLFFGDLTNFQPKRFRAVAKFLRRVDKLGSEYLRITKYLSGAIEQG